MPVSLAERIRATSKRINETTNQEPFPDWIDRLPSFDRLAIPDEAETKILELGGLTYIQSSLTPEKREEANLRFFRAVENAGLTANQIYTVYKCLKGLQNPTVNGQNLFTRETGYHFTVGHIRTLPLEELVKIDQLRGYYGADILKKLFPT